MCLVPRVSESEEGCRVTIPITRCRPEWGPRLRDLREICISPPTTSPAADISNLLITERSIRWRKFRRILTSSPRLPIFHLRVTTDTTDTTRVLMVRVTIPTLSTTTHISPTCLQSWGTLTMALPSLTWCILRCCNTGTASTKKLMREVLLITKTWRLSHNLECCLGRQMTVLKYFHKKNICIKQIMKMWGWHARDMRVKQKHVWVPHSHSDNSVFYIYKVDCYFFMFHVCIGTLITSSQASILRVRSFEKANKQFS